MKRYIRGSKEIYDSSVKQGVQRYLEDLASRVRYDKGVYPRFKVRSIELGDIDPSNWMSVYVNFTNENGQTFKHYVRFVNDTYNADDPVWVYEGDVFDRGDAIMFAAEDYCEEAGLY